MTGRMDTFGLTDIGLVRERNDDQFLIADLKKSVIIHQTSLSYDDETHLLGGSKAQLLLVADGVGGHPGDWPDLRRVDFGPYDIGLCRLSDGAIVRVAAVFHPLWPAPACRG